MAYGDFHGPNPDPLICQNGSQLDAVSLVAHTGVYCGEVSVGVILILEIQSTRDASLHQ